VVDPGVMVVLGVMAVLTVVVIEGAHCVPSPTNPGLHTHARSVPLK
jgi:hypothetical protein